MARERPKLIPVRFIQKNAPYNVNEIAGFDEAMVNRLIAAKKAVLYVPPAEAEPKPATKTPVKDAVGEVAKKVVAKIFDPPEPVVPVHDAGPYFMVGDERVRGKKAAQARADEINKAALEE